MDVMTGRVLRQVTCLHVVRLRSLVESFALSSAVHQDESSNPELLAGLGDSFHPTRLLRSLSMLELLLGHHSTALVLAEILLGEPTLGIHLGACPNLKLASSLAFLGHPLRLASSDSLRSLRFRSTTSFGGCAASCASSSSFCTPWLSSFPGSDDFDGHF